MGYLNMIPFLVNGYIGYFFWKSCSLEYKFSLKNNSLVFDYLLARGFNSLCLLWVMHTKYR